MHTPRATGDDCAALLWSATLRYARYRADSLAQMFGQRHALLAKFLPRCQQISIFHYRSTRIATDLPHRRHRFDRPSYTIAGAVVRDHGPHWRAAYPG